MGHHGQIVGVDGDKVGRLTDLEGAYLLLQSEHGCTVQGGHAQGVSRVAMGGVTGAVLGDERSDVSFVEQIQGVIRRSAIGAERDAYPGITKPLHIGKTGGQFQIGARAVHDPGTGVGNCGEVLV